MRLTVLGVACASACYKGVDALPVHLKANRYDLISAGDDLRTDVYEGRPRTRLDRSIEMRDGQRVMAMIVARGSRTLVRQSREDVSPHLAVERSTSEIEVEIAAPQQDLVWRARGTLREEAGLERTDGQWKRNLVDRSLDLRLESASTAGEVTSDDGRGISLRLGPRLHRIYPTRSAVGYLHLVDGRVAGHVTSAPQHRSGVRNAWLRAELPAETRQEALMAHSLVSAVCDLVQWTPPDP